ncbi:MAG TPA: hypothetical protein VFC77_07830, partial [Myxococcota bacterium]|nr:hypothetical protein [Myxococcota bacterium]
MSRDERRVRLPAAALWLAAIAVALIGIDLAERFAFYAIRPSDRTSFARSVRRPIKDSGLALLHGFSGTLDVSGLPAGTPVFDFHLKPRDAERLLEHLTLVRVAGTHDEQSKDDIDARMQVDGASYAVRLKLRGRQHYHVVPPRPSLRVNLRHGRSYRNATTFNLIEPFDKTADQTFLWEASEHGLIPWDTTMGVLAIDGRPLGVVQYVEQVRRETGDHALRPEGTFFRGTGELYAEGTDPARCRPLIERASVWLADSSADVPFEAMQETFDLERVRWFTALTEFSGDGHGFMAFNMKGYCDPVDPRLEFLIWDTRFGDWSRLLTSQFPDAGTQLLRNDRYRAWHDEALHALAHDRVEPMLERVHAFDEAWGWLLARDPFAWFPRSGPDGGFMAQRPERLARTLRANAQAILATLEGEDLAFEVDAAHRELRLATADRGAKRLEAVLWRGPDGPRRWSPPDPVTVYGRYRERQPLVAVALPPEIDLAAVEGVLAVNAHTGRAVQAVRAPAALAGVRVEPPRAQPPAIPPLPRGFALDAA